VLDMRDTAEKVVSLANVCYNHRGSGNRTSEHRIRSQLRGGEKCLKYKETRNPHRWTRTAKQNIGSSKATNEGNTLWSEMDKEPVFEGRGESRDMESDPPKTHDKQKPKKTVSKNTWGEKRSRRVGQRTMNGGETPDRKGGDTVFGATQRKLIYVHMEEDLTRRLGEWKKRGERGRPEDRQPPTRNPGKPSWGTKYS